MHTTVDSIFIILHVALTIFIGRLLLAFPPAN
jgi:hypothetical protein